jgi:hypothetical protein
VTISEIEIKISRILQVSPTQTELEPNQVFEHLAADLQVHLLNLTGLEERDIDGIQSEVQGNQAVYVGTWRGIRRLLLGVELRGRAEAHLALRATKGELDITDIDWGQVGADVGNSILIARLLHVGICSFRACGIRILTNDPWDERLRTLYSRMGFTNGTTLALDEPDSLRIALRMVFPTYTRFGIDFSAPPP